MNDVIKSINVGGIEYDIQAKELTKVTYAELKELRDNGGLVVGHLYRITDYEFTTKQVETKSAGHVFDIIVLAVAENELSHQARAIAHEGDTYFDGNDLGAWELWYELDNDAEKYAWADAENGKGIIYRMIDEKRNDCPYDFKNALFYNEKLTTGRTEDKYYYTFSYVVSGVLYDGTVEKQVKDCYGNSMGKTRTLLGKKEMNKNVFRNTAFAKPCHSNTFGVRCYSNTLEENCHSNTFGYYCYSNTFGDNCYSNTFGTECYANTFGYYCHSNTFGTECYANTFGYYCHSNTFGDNCYSNILGNNGSSNTFGNNCHSNTFWTECYANTFGYYCHSNTFGNSCQHNTFGNSCQHNTIGNRFVHNTLGDHVSDRMIGPQYIEKTSITLNDEYFDDGSGQLVPVKHPDLSTQPSILPYKFMGQYVYEQLIPKSELAQNLAADFFEVSHDKILFLEVTPVTSSTENSKVYSFNIANDGKYLLTADGMPSSGFSFPYLRVVYTSMPDEGGYYYDYQGQNVLLPTSGILVKFEGDSSITRVYDGYGADFTFIGNGYWHLNVAPADYPYPEILIYCDGVTLEYVFESVNIFDIEGKPITTNYPPEIKDTFINVVLSESSVNSQQIILVVVK